MASVDLLTEFAKLISNRADSFAAPSSTTSTDISTASDQVISTLFNASLASENAKAFLYNNLLSTLDGSKPRTRAQAKKLAGQKTSTFSPTPLSELYIPAPDTDDRDQVVWQQLEMKYSNLDKLTKQVLGHGDEDVDPDAEDEGALHSDQEQDEDMEDDSEASDSEDGSEEGFELEEQVEDDASYGLDSEFESDQEESILPLAGGTSSPISPHDSSKPSRLSLSNFDDPSTTRSKKRASSGPVSEVDDAFFSLKEFEDASEAGEKEMQRLLDLAQGKRANADDFDEADEEANEELNEGIDLFAPVPGLSRDAEEDDDEEDDEAEDLEDAQDITYDTFFAPPRELPRSKRPQKQQKSADAAEEADADTSRRSTVRFSNDVRVKSIAGRKSRGESMSLEDQMALLDAEMSAGNEDGASEDDDEQGSDASEDEEDDLMEVDDPEEDSQEEDSDEEEAGAEGGDAIHRLKSDLFDDDDDVSDAEEEGLSRHERRQRAIRAQIEELEQENIAKKEWTQSGEARAKDRPVNSLLEEDLEFEHIGKLVPQVTTELTQSLEEKIKQRILDEQFDDVEKKLAYQPSKFLPSNLLDISGNQSGKSLAELYAEDYSIEKQKAAGIETTDARDAALKKKHEEIESMFESIANKLDTLSNAHFTPKAPKTQITTISNAPAISMETALPTTTSNATLLAPEEVFKPDPAQSGGDISDLTPHQKKSMRQKRRKVRMNEQKKVAALGPDTAKTPNKRQQADDARQKLIGTRGVTVIGKGGSMKKGSGKNANAQDPIALNVNKIKL